MLYSGPSSDLKTKSPRRRATAGGIRRGGLRVDLLAHRERGRVRQASAYTHVDRGRAKASRPAPGAIPKLGGTASPDAPSSCAKSRCCMPSASSTTGSVSRWRSVIEPGQGGTGHRRVDLGNLHRAPDPAPAAIQSYGHVRRIAELRLVVGAAIRQAPAGRARVRPCPRVETERIGAGLKVHPAVRDTTIEQRVVVSPHVEH